MKGISILLTPTFSADDTRLALEQALGVEGVTIEKYEVRSSVTSLFQYLETNSDVDVVLVSQYIDNIPITFQDFERIQSLCRGDTRIVVLVSEEDRGGNYVRQLLEHGIFNGIYQDDAGQDIIASRMVHPLSRKDALRYYGLDVTGVGTQAAASSSETREAAKYIASYDGSRADLQGRLSQVNSRMDTNAFLETLSFLSDDLIATIGDFETYRYVADMAQQKKNERIGRGTADEKDTGEKKADAKKKKGLKLPSLPGLPKKLKKEKKTADKKDEYGTVQIHTVAFASINKGVGCTYSAIMCAETLANCGKKVAILELDNQDQHFASLCHIVMNTADISGVRNFSFGGVDYYFDVPFSVFEANYKGSYEYVIYDFGCCSTDIVNKVVIRCNNVFIIGSAAEYRYAEIAECYNEFSPIDLQDAFVYLFTDYDVHDLGVAAQIIKKGRFDAIGQERDPFCPSKQTQTLFKDYLFNSPGRMKEPAPVSLYEKLKPKRSLNVNTLSIILAVLCFLVAVLFAVTVSFKNRECRALEDDLRLVKTQATDLLNEKDMEITQEKARLQSYVKTVTVLNRNVSTGTKITEDMLTTKDILTDLEEGVYLSKEDIVGKYAACNITADRPLYDYFLAVPVEEPMPSEEEIQE